MRFDDVFFQILTILSQFVTPIWSAFGANRGKKDVPKFDAKICDFKGSRVLGRGGGGGPI